jgi:hypothetical protein
MTDHTFGPRDPKGDPFAPPRCTRCGYSGKTLKTCEEYWAVKRTTTAAFDSANYRPTETGKVGHDAREP